MMMGISRPLDFGPLDRWIARFRAPAVSDGRPLNSGNIRGARRGTERWATAMGEWATLLSEHL